MNPAKAREYFTDYHEGTLDRGLREAFDRAMQEDAELYPLVDAREQSTTRSASSTRSRRFPSLPPTSTRS